MSQHRGGGCCQAPPAAAPVQPWGHRDGDSTAGHTAHGQTGPGAPTPSGCRTVTVTGTVTRRWGGHGYTPCCAGSYLPRRMFLNPQPVPPRTMAATSTAPAMEPIMILVPLGPVTEGTGRRGQGHTSVGRGHGDIAPGMPQCHRDSGRGQTQPQGTCQWGGDRGTPGHSSPSAVGTWEGGKPSHRDTPQWGRDEGTWGHSSRDDPELWGPGKGANPAMPS